MTIRRTAAIVLAAGQGTRMKSAQPKVLHRIANKPMILHLIDTLASCDIQSVCVVIGPNMELLKDAVAPHDTVEQSERLGTAHAALCARDTIGDGFDDILVLNGDNPLIQAESILNLLSRRVSQDAAVSVLGFNTDAPGAYGRMITADGEKLIRIVEAKDATPEELTVKLCSSGMMALDGKVAFEMLSQIGNDNAQGEYYLPDIIDVAKKMGRTCTYATGNEVDLLGINSRAELAVAERIFQQRLRAEIMASGVTMIDPDTVYLSADTKIGADTVIEPHVFCGAGVTIGNGVTIKAFSHLEGTEIGNRAVIGPFARLRPGTKLGNQTKIGNFVETKNAAVADGAKINHLSYVGDATVGEAANIGAGTITCNYDGVFKWQTTIGGGAFIGSNTALVAPVTIGDGAVVGAGSTITSDVEPDALAVTRANMREIADWGRKTRERKKALKAKGKKG